MQNRDCCCYSVQLLLLEIQIAMVVIKVGILHLYSRYFRFSRRCLGAQLVPLITSPDSFNISHESFFFRHQSYGFIPFFSCLPVASIAMYTYMCNITSTVVLAFVDYNANPSRLVPYAGSMVALLVLSLSLSAQARMHCGELLTVTPQDLLL